MKKTILFLFILSVFYFSQQKEKGSIIVPSQSITIYSDKKPSAKYRLNVRYEGIVYKHGSGPDSCDYLGARDIWIWKYKNIYYMHYDGAGPKGWLTCIAVSKNLKEWESKGKVIDFGKIGSSDCASSSYGTVYYDGNKWHMFYLGTPNTSEAPNFVPAFPYLTMKAESKSLLGPWKKRYDIIPFTIEPQTYYSSTASPGFILKQGSEYLMFFQQV